MRDLATTAEALAPVEEADIGDYDALDAQRSALEARVAQYRAQAEAMTEIADYLPSTERREATEVATSSLSLATKLEQRLQEITGAMSPSAATAPSVSGGLSQLIERECDLATADWYTEMSDYG